MSKTPPETGQDAGWDATPVMGLGLHWDDVKIGQRFRTLERLVSRIADVMLERFPVDSIRVRATKPEPPVPFTMEGASVEIFRRRDA